MDATPDRERREARRFGGIVACIFLAIAVVSHLRHHETRGIVLGSVAAAIAFLTFLVFPLWLPIFRLWMRAAHWIWSIVIALLLALFYIAILTPVGLARRVLGRSPVDLDWKDGRPSYWVAKEEQEARPGRYARPF